MSRRYAWLRELLSNEETFHRIVSDFWSWIDFQDCWLWFGTTNTNGYGVIWIPDGKAINAHTLSLILHGEEFGPDDITHHICNQNNCVKPDHLKRMTHADHIRLHKRLKKQQRESQVDAEMRQALRDNLRGK